jgi:hypothetical protein
MQTAPLMAVAVCCMGTRTGFHTYISAIQQSPTAWGLQASGPELQLATAAAAAVPWRGGHAQRRWQRGSPCTARSVPLAGRRPGGELSQLPQCSFAPSCSVPCSRHLRTTVSIGQVASCTENPTHWWSKQSALHSNIRTPSGHCRCRRPCQRPPALRWSSPPLLVAPPGVPADCCHHRRRRRRHH